MGPFNPFNAESLLSGSHGAFKKRERPLFSEEEQEIDRENKRTLQQGIDILRKMRTRALDGENYPAQQDVLREAHHLSRKMAGMILERAAGEKPSPLDPDFVEELNKAEAEYKDTDPGSAHAIPPSLSIGNLLRAADDLLVRVEEKCASLSNPDHQLTEEETRSVLSEFLRGINDLSIDAIEKFFARDTKVGGILSGGSVYAEMVKKIVDRYADPDLAIETFVIAVDKEKKKAAFESGDFDQSVKTVIITDDLIDKGGTVLTALWSAGEHFPNATIYSGMGTDQPGGFERRRAEKHLDHLATLYYEYVDVTDEGKNKEALALFARAERYAQENNVPLPPGWYKRKERIEQSE